MFTLQEPKGIIVTRWQTITTNKTDSFGKGNGDRSELKEVVGSVTANSKFLYVR